MHLEIAANLCVSRLDIKNVLKFGNVSHVLEKALIIQEKRFIIAKTYEINKGRVRTLYQKQISRTFPGLFKDSDSFFKGS